MRRYLIITVALLLGAALNVRAQVSKTVYVTGKNGFTDFVSLSKERPNMDISVKFSYDEQNNTLTVGLYSYRGLFVFEKDTKYSDVFCFGKFKPKKLRYDIVYNPKDKFYATRAFKKSIPSPRGRYVFKPWIETEGLQRVPDEYNMLNDYVEAKFNILNERVVVDITLRDVMLMDPAAKEYKYYLSFDKDLRCRYDIAILKDACFGKDEEIAAAGDSLKSITAAYDSLAALHKSNSSSDSAYVKMFKNMKDILIGRFAKADADCDCDCLRVSREKYNGMLDKINEMTMTYVSRSEESGGIDASLMIARARNIDKNVSRWLLSDDSVEKKDIIKNCNGLIAACKADIEKFGVRTKTQKDAVQVFLSAEEYFNKTCR